MKISRMSFSGTPSGGTSSSRGWKPIGTPTPKRLSPELKFQLSLSLTSHAHRRGKHVGRVRTGAQARDAKDDATFLTILLLDLSPKGAKVKVVPLGRDVPNRERKFPVRQRKTGKSEGHHRLLPRRGFAGSSEKERAKMARFAVLSMSSPRPP